MSRLKLTVGQYGLRHFVLVRLGERILAQPMPPNHDRPSREPVPAAETVWGEKNPFFYDGVLAVTGVWLALRVVSTVQYGEIS